jgi:hypothetical protein
MATTEARGHHERNTDQGRMIRRPRYTTGAAHARQP